MCNGWVSNKKNSKLYSLKCSNNYLLNTYIPCSYDIIDHHIPDVFRHYLSKHHQLEQDKGRLPQKWKQIWDKLETPQEDENWLIREPSITTLQVRALGRSLHKKSTMDILVRGKLVRSSDISNIYNNSAHRFEKHTFTTITNCDTCGTILLGKVGMIHVIKLGWMYFFIHF
jgi:myotubularin-related protein 5/13